MRIRLWALERARDHGFVTTADLRERFDLSTKNAARHMTHLRRCGLLEAVDDRQAHGSIRSEITEAGEKYLANPPEPRRRMDARPLARALGYRVVELRQ